MALDKFQYFFDCCVGRWTTERTYHYLRRNEVERSRTEFVIHPLSNDLKVKVLADNQRTPPRDLDPLPGYHLEFETVSETGEEVSQKLNILFVPHQMDAPMLEGDYLRDRAYEEDKPMVAHFRFDPEAQELFMTTHYTRLVATDSIRFVKPDLRIRQIITYARPPEGQPLEEVALVGFGVEVKS
jgi:hypothetical protein